MAPLRCEICILFQGKEGIKFFCHLATPLPIRKSQNRHADLKRKIVTNVYCLYSFGVIQDFLDLLKPFVKRDPFSSYDKLGSDKEKCFTYEKPPADLKR